MGNMEEGIQTAAAGDTVYFRGGTYPYDGLGNLWFQTAAHMITLSAF